MKYRHAFHAGNFADVHKHVTLLALLEAMRRKEKGFLFVDTHAGRGLYDLRSEAATKSPEWRGGIGRLLPAGGGGEATASPRSALSPEVERYLAIVRELRARHGRETYPGSPLLAARELREQDRGVAFEIEAGELAALGRAVPKPSQLRFEQADAFERLRALLPPRERRALVLLDPPYEETRRDFERVLRALEDALRRFATCVVMIWYPVKQARDDARWQARLEARLARDILFGELRLHAADSRVSLNGSGIAIVNPPYLIEERMRAWLPDLHAKLAADAGGGVSIRAVVGAGAAARDASTFRR